MELNLKNEFAIFRNEEPYKFVKQILTIERTVIGENYLEEFRWSVDNNTFSSWVKLAGEILRSLPLIEEDENLYIQNRITNLDDIPIAVEGYAYTFKHWTARELDIQYPPVICDTRGTLKFAIEVTSAIFKPYEVNQAICLYNELNYTVQNLFGWDVEYFRVEPDLKTIDPILMEYSLAGTYEKKCIKLLVPDNEFPDAKPEFIPMGIEFEMPFEVHIDKTYWQELYPGTMPQKDDIIYFPLERRIYEVLNSYAVKAFMEQESYYSVALGKYAPKSNIQESHEIEEYLHDISTSVEREFDETTTDIVEDISNQQQFDRFQGSKYDITRSFIHEDIVIDDEKVNSGNVILMERHYSLGNLSGKSAIIYRQHAVLQDEFAFSAWLNVINTRTVVQTDNVTNFALIDNNITFKIDRIRQYDGGDWIEFKRGEIKFIVIVDSTSESGGETTITGFINENILNNLNQRFPNWSMLGNYQISPAFKNTLLYGQNVDDDGIEIGLLLNRYVYLNISGDDYFYPLNTDIKFSEWYGIVVNISNKFKQIDVELWGINPDEHETGLVNLYTKTTPIESIVFDTTAYYQLVGSPLKLTNIRIWNQTMQIEKQEMILSQFIVQDSHLAPTIDNAIPINTLPYIARIDQVDESNGLEIQPNKTTIDIEPFLGQDPDMGIWVEGEDNKSQDYNITNDPEE